MGVKLKSFFCVILILCFGVSLSSCSSKNSNAGTSETVEAVIKVCEDDKMCFMLDDKKIEVKDELLSAKAITDIEWIGSNIAITCHVNPSLEYFTVYDVEKEDFNFNTYGVGFVWKDEDIQSLVYIDTPAHFADKEEPYQIMNYDGKVIVTTDDEISDLAIKDNEVTYKTTLEDGSVSEEQMTLT